MDWRNVFCIILASWFTLDVIGNKIIDIIYAIKSKPTSSQETDPSTEDSE